MIGEGRRSSFFSWGTVGRVGFTGIFLFWIYLLWNSTADLHSKLNSVTDQNSAIHHVQIEFKNEIQDWKDLLLRSTNQDSLNTNWRIYEAQYQKVAAGAGAIVRSGESPDINDQLKNFVDAHTVNHEIYFNSLDMFSKSGFDSHLADAAVRDIDLPLLGQLETIEAGMLENSRKINDRLVDEAQNKIEQHLYALAFLALLAVWLPKY